MHKTTTTHTTHNTATQKLLIFDLDGTLIDSVPDLAMAVNFALQQMNLPVIAQDVIRRFVGNGAEVLAQRAVFDVLGYHDDTITQAVFEHFLGHYKTHYCDKTVLYNGVKDGLQALDNAGFTMAIATNKPSEFVMPILKTLQIDRFFVMTVGGDSLPAKKPDSLPLVHICQTLGFSSLQAVMIGDSKNDIIAGQNAQMTTCGLTYGYNYDEPISHYSPTFVFDDFGALTCHLLKDIHGK